MVDLISQLRRFIIQIAIQIFFRSLVVQQFSSNIFRSIISIFYIYIHCSFILLIELKELSFYLLWFFIYIVVLVFQTKQMFIMGFISLSIVDSNIRSSQTKQKREKKKRAKNLITKKSSNKTFRHVRKIITGHIVIFQAFA